MQFQELTNALVIQQQHTAALLSQQQQQLVIQQQQAQAVIVQQVIVQQQSTIDALQREQVNAHERAMRGVIKQLAALPRYDSFSLPISGGRLTFQRIVETRVSASNASRSLNYARVSNLKLAREQLAGGKEHVSTLMLHDARANPQAYKEVGIMSKVIIDAEESCAVCREMTGALGDAWCRWMKSHPNVSVASKAARRAQKRTAHHPCVTGKIVIDDPKRPGKVRARSGRCGSVFRYLYIGVE
mmetsp:Transcript_81726/g.162655  ORF Transcript_81726/g.162655 Transcript_81726/m.162655 type:complete len:243 (-) Transcript_81726:14-742(-)